MGAEKKLQRHLDKMGKKYGNTADVEDGREEINQKMEKIQYSYKKFYRREVVVKNKTGTTNNELSSCITVSLNNS